MNGHLFPREIEAALFAGSPCGRCGGAGRLLKVRYPRVRRWGHQIELIYSYRCACGAFGKVRVMMPILLFCLAATWKKLIYADHGNPLSRPMRDYQGDSPHCLTAVVREYYELLRDSPRDPSGVPTDVERFLVGFNEFVWRDFISGGESENDENDKEDISEPE